MTDNIAIRVRRLGKKFIISGPQEQYHTFRDVIVNSLKAQFKRFHPAPTSEEFYGLKDMLLDIDQGEIVRDIFRNSAGKSTLLKNLSWVTSPPVKTVKCLDAWAHCLR